MMVVQLCPFPHTAVCSCIFAWKCVVFVAYFSAAAASCCICTKLIDVFVDCRTYRICRTYMWCSVAPEKLRVWRGPWCGTFVWRGGALVVSVADQGQKVGILVQSATNISG